MRRAGFALVAAGLVVTACGGLRDTFTSRTDTAAKVRDLELPAARVAEIITRLGGPTANPEAAGLITGIWVDVSRRPPQAVTTSPAATSANPARRMTISSVRV